MTSRSISQRSFAAASSAAVAIAAVTTVTAATPLAEAVALAKQTLPEYRVELDATRSTETLLAISVDGGTIGPDWIMVPVGAEGANLSAMISDAACVAKYHRESRALNPGLGVAVLAADAKQDAAIIREYGAAYQIWSERLSKSEWRVVRRDNLGREWHSAFFNGEPLESPEPPVLPRLG